jgi:hypothetical protein
VQNKPGDQAKEVVDTGKETPPPFYEHCPVCRGFVMLVAFGCSGQEVVKLLQLKARME